MSSLINEFIKVTTTTTSPALPHSLRSFPTHFRSCLCLSQESCVLQQYLKCFCPLASFWTPDCEQNGVDHLHSVSDTKHPDLQVLPLHTRDTHHHPSSPLYLPPPCWHNFSGRYFTNWTCGMLKVYSQHKNREKSFICFFSQQSYIYSKPKLFIVYISAETPA